MRKFSVVCFLILFNASNLNGSLVHQLLLSAVSRRSCQARDKYKLIQEVDFYEELKLRTYINLHNGLIEEIGKYDDNNSWISIYVFRQRHTK